jgi:uncharacterized membrane-anchored protein YhcB (DUF1043 family)
MRILGLILIALFLSGCSFEANRLKAENENLRMEVQQLRSNNIEIATMLNQEYAARMAEFNKLEHLAGIAQGCRVLFNVCPESITKPGDLAIASGASGAFTLQYWVIKIIKFSLLIGLVIVAVLLWSMRLRPDLRAKVELESNLAETRDNIKEAKSELEVVLQEKIKAQNDCILVRKELNQLNDQLDEASDDLEDLHNKTAEVDAQIKQKETALRALGAFKRS